MPTDMQIATPTYRVQFRKQIHGNFASASSEDRYVHRWMDLPIPPFVGLSVSDGDFEATIQELHYDASKRELRAYVEANKELYEAGLKTNDPFGIRSDPTARRRRRDEIVQEYVSVGWVADGD